MTPVPDTLFTYRTGLDLPVIGMESEFSVTVDDVELAPEEIWKHPGEFIAGDLLARTSKAVQLPTGGALYFDKGVIEVVTPVIEIAPECTSRMVRSLWEQVAFLRDQLSGWERESGRRVRLKGFSSHYNVTYEIPSEERNRDRTIQKLAFLLAYVLPIPVILLGTNRRSTGVGVRPRRDRIEVTLDFTPDPGLTLVTAALIVGAVREIIRWPSYRIDVLDSIPIEIPTGVTPGRHTTRKGWLMRDYHFERSPFSSDPDEEVWATTKGRVRSLRQIALSVADYFRDAIAEVCDRFTFELLYSVLEGRTASLLDLPDRPAAYDDVGRIARWGSVIPDLENYGQLHANVRDAALTRHMHDRLEARDAFLRGGDEPVVMKEDELDDDLDIEMPQRRAADLDTFLPPWNPVDAERRTKSLPPPDDIDRRLGPRRSAPHPIAPERLTRSRYEKVFLDLAARKPLLHDGKRLVPVSMKGWYEAIFRAEPGGEEHHISVDELRKRLPPE